MSKRKGKQMSNLPHSYIEAMEELQMENEQLRQRILILEKQAKNNEVLDLVVNTVCSACSGSGRYCEFACGSCGGTGEETD